MSTPIPFLRPRLPRWPFVVMLVAALGLTATAVLADNSAAEQEYYSLTKDGVAPDATRGHARAIAGFDDSGLPTLFRWVRVDNQGRLVVVLPVGAPADVNLAQVAGVATAAGNGVVTASTLRIVEASDSAVTTRLGTIAAWDEAGRAAINLIPGQIGVAAGAGASGPTTPRVVLASDQALPPGANALGSVAVTSMPALPTGTNSVGTVQAPQVVPQVPATVACDTNGNINWTANSADVRVALWNTSTTQDVCVRWGAVAAADITTLTSCSFVLGAYAGSGSADVWETPAGMRVGSESFACDVAAATASLAIVAWRAQ